MQRRHHQVGSINQRLIKLKQGQKTAFPFPLMVSPLRTSSLNPYSLPFFIPLHFACRWRPNPFHLFALFSIAMFTGLGFNPFFYLRLLSKLVSKLERMSLYLKLSAFGDIEYLLLILFGSAVGIGYCTPYFHFCWFLVNHLSAKRKGCCILLQQPFLRIITYSYFPCSQRKLWWNLQKASGACWDGTWTRGGTVRRWTRGARVSQRSQQGARRERYLLSSGRPR